MLRKACASPGFFTCLQLATCRSPLQDLRCFKACACHEAECYYLKADCDSSNSIDRTVPSVLSTLDYFRVA
eukprot:6469173-Amphidinium_carterae.2